MTDMTQYLNKRLAKVKTSPILTFSTFAKTIPHIVNFTVGEPDFNTPEHIKQAATTSIEHNRSHYAPSNGTPALKQATCQFLANKYQQHFNPNEIIITEGASEGIYTAILSVLNPGDKAIIPTPTFPLYIDDVNLAGGQPILVDTSKTGFKLTPQLLQTALEQAGSDVRLLILNYPSNPTGVTYSQAELHALARVIKDQPIFVLCDEIYSELNYDQPHASLVNELPDQTILITGLSKSHAMTGWRIGIMAAPKAITDELSKIHQFTITSTPTMIQDAAQEALANGPDDALPMKQEYQRRRDYIVEHLNDLGFSCASPKGAFYVFAKIAPDLQQDDVEFAYDLAKNGLVAAVPGSYFGPGGQHHLRFSYATSFDNIQQGMSNLTKYVAQQRAKKEQ
ncbi:aminotransferase class I/II-fold pyridoxal phosphate-dependent enzyme [Bombilactobacillus folatiphilus]|uniref:Aminotransferase n=1 Tax=Bombilactobacillus folatiphilus TaxID=2923362 RepID=A0ABY4P8R1_9LACO|nr:aminotransferase class I/II-fold pyridoxal phosphate-dependent enzyme [Bombilactobacillus folatiphilus]UQS81959.1 aminotransferase class I/II-fold pyridoxal phosphate-dependent enzyme [Bombilactobacillus folatiphilus]